MSDLLGQKSLDRSPPAARGFLYLRVALGLFLLATAGLKAHGLTIDPVAQDSFLASPQLVVASIEIEIILGLWLLSGWSGSAAWATTLAFFGILGAFSLILALAGQGSCGCFGQVTISPLVTFALDVVVVAALVLCRPKTYSYTYTKDWFIGLLKTGAGALFLLFLTSGLFLLIVDNPADALARLRGDSITIDPPLIYVGEGAFGEEREFSIRLRNHADYPVRIVGGTTNCWCIATGALPVTLAPGESQQIGVKMRFTGGTGRFRHHFVLYTDDELQRFVVCRFAGRLVN